MSPALPYRVFAVDPATTVSAWAVLDVVSFNPLKIVVVAHAQIDGQKLLKERRELSSMFSKQFCVLDALEEAYTRLLEEYKPNVVVSEGAFAHLHVSAALALTLAIHTLRRVSRNVLGLNVIEVPPTITKRAFANHGGADKDLMRKAYESCDYLTKTDAIEISEHEIDAIGHGVGHVKRDITGEVIQISALEKKRAKREKQKLLEEKKKT